jgi:hypothetical protein
MLCLVLGLAVTVVVAMVSAILIERQVLEENAAGWTAMAAVILGTALSSVMAPKGKGWSILWHMGAGAVYWIGLAVCGLMLFGQLRDGLLPTMCICLGTSAAIGLIGKSRGRKPTYHVPKMRL